MIIQHSQPSMSSRIRRDPQVTKVRKKSKPQSANCTPRKRATPNSNDILQQKNTIDADANGNEIDTIRNIIFGRQMANYEDRFTPK